MKKFLAILLTLAMVLSMATVVSADVVTVNGNEYDETLVKELVTAETEVDAYKWWNFVENSREDISAVAKLLNASNVYVKVTVKGNVSAPVMCIQSVTSGDDISYAYAVSTSESTTYYYSGAAIVESYIAKSSDTALTFPDYWGNLVCKTQGSKANYTASIVALGNNNPHITGLYYSYNEDIVILGTFFRASSGDGTFSFTHPFTVKWYSGNELLTTTVRRENRVEEFVGGASAPTLLRGDVEHPAVDGWYHNTWTPDANKVPTHVEIWSNGVLLDTYVLAEHANEDAVQQILAAWGDSKVITGETLEGNMPAKYDEVTENTVYTGYFSTGDDTHAVIINGAIITSNHEFNANGDCIYCGHHKDLEEDEVVIETPVESTEEEVDTDDTEDTVDVEEKEDTNPTTGIALAVVPMMVAAAAVVASKRR